MIHIGPLLTGLSLSLLLVSLGPVWDAITIRKIESLSGRMAELRIDRKHLQAYLRWWGIAMFASVALFGLLNMWPVAAAVLFLIYVCPELVLGMLIQKRIYRLRDQMVSATVMLTNTSRAGLTLSEGFAEIANEIPNPLGQEFKRVVHEHEHGRPLAEVLIDLKNELQLDGFTILVNAALVALERGGRITDALERITKSLQENQRLERKLEADTESGKQVVIILCLFPFAFLALFGFMHPEGTSAMFGTIIGQIVFVVVVALIYISARMSHKILNIEM